MRWDRLNVHASSDRVPSVHCRAWNDIHGRAGHIKLRAAIVCRWQKQTISCQAQKLRLRARHQNQKLQLQHAGVFRLDARKHRLVLRLVIYQRSRNLAKSQIFWLQGHTVGRDNECIESDRRTSFWPRWNNQMHWSIICDSRKVLRFALQHRRHCSSVVRPLLQHQRVLRGRILVFWRLRERSRSDRSLREPYNFNSIFRKKDKNWLLKKARLSFFANGVHLKRLCWKR